MNFGLLKMCICTVVLGFLLWGNPYIFAESFYSKSYLGTQQSELKTVSGVVVDESGEPLIGATIHEKDTDNITISDSYGKFTITVASSSSLIISYMGFDDEEISVAGKSSLRIVLRQNATMLNELVVVGYGTQKKESVVGSIATVQSEEIMQSGGVTTVGQALQGKIPGVVTLYTSGEPGTDDIEIYIRGQSSWNNKGTPLILVDGVERSMSDVNMEDIESISVLKDASATAVYGVKGANGVILLTTKRGQEGKAEFTVSANSVFKTISKVPEKYDSFNAMMIMNEAVMNELAYNPASWDLVTPVQVADRYRNQPSQELREMYPNVDWRDFMFKDVAVDYQVNASVRGGNNFAKYYCSLSFLQENDIVKDFDNGRGYSAGNNYQRFNYRSNLDLNITKTTKFSINLSGIYGIKMSPPLDSQKERMFLSLYNLAPDLYYPIYSDGCYGYSDNADLGTSNSIVWYSVMGRNKQYSFKVNADLKLTQNLDFITKGLSAHVRFTMDNYMQGNQAINDKTGNAANIKSKFYDPKTESWKYDYPLTSSDYEYAPAPWTINDFTVGSSKIRLIDYEAAVNYARSFNDRHNVGALFLFKRQEYAKGNMFPEYNEDWVFRVTYDFNKRYLIEANGAYNGSERFGPGYRFDFFPSVGIGWVLSNEPFMKNIGWIDRIKFRASAGMVGDDNFTSSRWLYQSQWAPMNYYVAMSNPIYFGSHKENNAKSPYMAYKESLMGNKDIHWEKSFKRDYGMEFSFLNGSISGEFDYFLEHRQDIYIPGGSRAMNDLMGIAPPGANLGEVKVRGYEAVINLAHRFGPDFRLNGNFSFTHAKDIVINRDDPELRPFYLKQAGYSIGQQRSAIRGDMMQSWDDVYMSTPLTSGDQNKRVGYYDVVDFDGDGIYYGTTDNAPYGYPTRPQNTWTASLGGEYKGFSVTVQFFGQFNTTRNYVLESWSLNTHLYFKNLSDYWSKDNPDGEYTLAAINTKQANMDPYRNLVDASMVRLKMVELSYRLPAKACRKIGLKGLRIYVNGNNLYLWTKMADDRDFGSGNRGAYPTLKRFNVGLNFNL